MSDAELIQGTDAWRLARCGSLGASQIGDALAKTKSGWGASRANIMADLIVERLTGIPKETYTNFAMQQGTEREPEARATYEFLNDVTVEQVGFIRHPGIPGSHCSPDGLIGKDGGLEIKCPQPAQHLATLLGEPVAAKYVTQMLFSMAVTRRKFWVFVSYNPDFPESMRLFQQLFERDDNEIARIEKEVRVFLNEAEAKLADLKARYDIKAAA